MGSPFASCGVEVVILKALHMFEPPFLLVGTFKYLSPVFDPRLPAILFLIGFNLMPLRRLLIDSATVLSLTSVSTSTIPDRGGAHDR
ncbi:hypothetical protein GRH90_23750 [Enterobacteriales bacterium SAP-6]|uniref:Uncharacterized protein n=1 Tax=Acerihabitans arboris TaxID=2691583 RepID=A0A845SKF0_9GAMM|nr:hypothetical protein [Acerihabitans arboris]